jgi:putative heme iron utilization protein
MNLAQEARQFLRSTRRGILSTNSQRHPGYPFGSVAPFVPDHAGNPLVLISTLAEHTRNIAADCKVSLLAFEGADDLQANARLTLVGEAEQTDKQDAALQSRYLRYLPEAAGYFAAHDFLLYRIHVREARYIGGFGRIAWIAGDQLLAAASRLPGQEAAILGHMNADHGDSLRDYCRHYHRTEAVSAEMIGIDSDGFDVRADGSILRFAFEAPVIDAQSARSALVAMAQAARA